MKTGLWFTVGLMLLGDAVRAATVTQIFSQTIGHHWLEPDDGGGNNYWSDGLIPTTTNDYHVPGGFVLRAPEGNGAPDFPGLSLTIDAGSTLAMKMGYGQDTFMLGDLILNGGTLGSWVGTGGTGFQTLDLNTNLFRVTTNSVFTLVGTNRRRLRLRNAVLTGSGGLTINANEVNDLLELPASVTASNFTGSWTINGGTLSVVDGAVFGSTNIGVVINTQASQAGINSPGLNLNGTQVGAIPLEMNSDVSGLRTRLQALSGSNEWAGPMTLKGNGSLQLNAQNAGTVLTLSGGLSGTNTTALMIRGAGGLGFLASPLNMPNGGLFKTDSGRWVITTNGHALASAHIAVGRLEMGIRDALPTNLVVRLGQGGSSADWDLGGYDQKVAGITVVAGTPANQVIGSSSTNQDARLTLNGGGSNIFSGRIVNALPGGTRTVGLTIDGGYHLTLSGNNPFTGPTLVSNGTLLVSGRVGGAVLVHSNSIYGGGGLCANLTVLPGGLHEPGLSGVGTDGIVGAYDLQGGLHLEIDGTNAVADQVVAGGLLTLGPGSSLDITELTPADDFIYILMEYGSRAGLIGMTNGVPAGYRLLYDFGPASNRIVLVRGMYFWDGEALDDLWSSNINWLDDVAPPAVTPETVYFDVLGAANAPGILTSALDQDRSVGRLQMATDIGAYHSIDLNGFSLQVDGTLSITSPARDTDVTVLNTATNGELIVTNGTLRLGYNGSVSRLGVDAPFTFHATNGTIDMARREGSIASNTVSTLDFSNAPRVHIWADQIRMASATANNGGRVRGILRMSWVGTNRISTTNWVVGDSLQQGNTDAGASEIHFGAGRNELNADQMTLGIRKSLASSDVGAGGSLRLRGLTKTDMNLRLGFNLANTATIGSGIFNASGAALDARFGRLELGRHMIGNGGGVGTFIMDNGIASASNLALAVTGGANPNNTRGNLTVNGGFFAVRDSVSDGAGAGTILVNDGLMTVTNDLMLDTLVVGGTGNNNATMIVGRAVSLGTGSQNIRLARNTASGTSSYGLLDLSGASNVSINASLLELGTGSGRAFGTLLLSENGSNTIHVTTLTMGNVNPDGNTADWSHFVAANSTVINATDITVGRAKSRAEMVISTNGGSLFLGGVSNRIANLRIGFNAINTGSAGRGILNGSNGTLRVYASTVVLGRHDGTSNLGGSGTGILILDSSNDFVDATSLFLGRTDGDVDATATGEILMEAGRLQAVNIQLANAKDFGDATGTIHLFGGGLTASSMLRGLTTGTTTVNFNWLGGELTVSHMHLGTTLVQNGGELVPGGLTNIGSTSITGDYAVATGAWNMDLDPTGFGTSDFVHVSGTLSLSNAVLHLGTNVLDDPFYVIGQYGSRNGTFGAVTNLPAGYSVLYDFGPGGNQIAVGVQRAGTMIIVK